jgi:RimJ/RimL family protein N-acetyltransferase
MFDFRPARMSDADTLFAWRNDPVTRAGFRSTAEVPREDHDRWMQFNVLQGYPTHIVMIAETDEGSCGVVRFDADRRDVMSYETSVIVAPNFRGRGLGAPMLAAACANMSGCKLHTVVRPENAASRKTFEGAGFVHVGEDGEFMLYKKEQP